MSERTNKLTSPEFMKIYQNHDILLLNETWTSDLYDVSIEGFEHMVLNRTEKKPGTKRNSGGLVVYIKSELFDENTLVKFDGDEQIWFKLKNNIISDKPIYFCLCYVLPPGTTRNSMVDSCIFDRMLDTVAEIESKEQDCSFIICGDMNARTRESADYLTDDNSQHVPLPEDYTLDENIPPRFSLDKNASNANGNMLLSFCKQTSLRIANGRYGSDKMVGNFTCTTSRGRSLVDYVLANKYILDKIESFDIGEPNILSDHHLVSFSLSTHLPSDCNEDAPSKQEHADYKYQWDCSKKENYIERLSSPDTLQALNDMRSKLLESITFSDTIDESVSIFVSTIEGCASPLFLRQLGAGSPQVSDAEGNFRKSNAPWFTEDCASRRYDFYKCLNLFRGDNSDENRQNMVHARSKYKTCLRNSRLLYDKSETDKLNKLRYTNARDYWKLLKRVSQNAKPNIQLSTFERYFKAVNSPVSQFYVPDDDIVLMNDRYIRGELDVMFDELNLPLTRDEILKAIKQLKNNKSAGPDKLINEFYVHGSHVLLPYIDTLFNTIFSHGYFPKEWSMGDIIPLHKKGSINNVDNYGGITLLSTLGKLFT